MKMLQGRLLATALALVALAAATACQPGPASNSNGGTANNANTSKPTPSPGNTNTANANTNTSSSSTPTKTFLAFYEASKNKDVEGVKKTLSKDTLDFFTNSAKQKNQTLEEALAESLKGADVPANTPETRNEKIDGDRATLESKDEKTGRWDTLNFIKENGEWKLKLNE